VSPTPKDELAELFHDIVLALGGVFAVRGVDDLTVRQAAAGLERTYLRARSKRRQSGGNARDGQARHPAIARLLRLTRNRTAAPSAGRNLPVAVLP
jgi:hypothetical protein